ncbi:sulfurtransferase TusA family protein [Microaceticoccus formicicus]|uniref:sulfurtransferase TusA family protein n=1 Tax=Microaceticoccus formicicus TaxID=3118105 RepID=UPI003CD04E25|nr:sulfurtransferase TusA family protein [Peptoniphilaceae bacterium AMB_02]
MKEIDVRGYSCPEPVIRTMNAVKEGNAELEILVDTNVSKENVSRYLKENGYNVDVKETGDYYTIIGKK